MKISTIRNLLMAMKICAPEKKNLTHALGFSALVYFSNKFISDEISKMGYPYKIIEYNNMKCLIAETDTAIYISFRGTEPTKILNWKRILNIIPKSFQYGTEVHGGFLLYYNDYADFVKSYIESIKTDKQVIFTGHSLGAAIASLFNMTYSKTSKAICFGSPKLIYKKPFLLPEESYKITADFITLLPIDLPGFKWYRTSDTIKLLSRNKYLFPLSYHSLENYIQTMI